MVATVVEGVDDAGAVHMIDVGSASGEEREEIIDNAVSTGNGETLGLSVSVLGNSFSCQCRPLHPLGSWVLLPIFGFLGHI